MATAMRSSVLQRGVLALSFVGLLAGWHTAAAQTAGEIKRTAALRTFDERIGAYVALRARLEQRLPSFEARRDPWSALLARNYLASAIRTARPQAQLGDTFTPHVASLFREAIAGAIDEEGIEGGAASDLSGMLAVDLVVHEPVPFWAMTQVPDAIAAYLPPLPEAVEFRRANGALLLWDSHAWILIDALHGVFPAS